MKKILHKLVRYFTNADYEELKEDWEEQNAIIDNLTAEKNRKQKRIDKLKQEIKELKNHSSRRKKVK